MRLTQPPTAALIDRGVPEYGEFVTEALRSLSEGNVLQAEKMAKTVLELAWEVRVARQRCVEVTNKACVVCCIVGSVFRMCVRNVCLCNVDQDRSTTEVTPRHSVCILHVTYDQSLQELHIGEWKSVAMVWRDLYALGALTSAMCALRTSLHA